VNTVSFSEFGPLWQVGINGRPTTVFLNQTEFADVTSKNEEARLVYLMALLDGNRSEYLNAAVLRYGEMSSDGQKDPGVK
jgi:hypothetical protein